jgi:hypothetical protein
VRFFEQYAQARGEESRKQPQPIELPYSPKGVAHSVKTEAAEQVLPGGTDKELRTGSAAVSEIKV